MSGEVPEKRIHPEAHGTGCGKAAVVTASTGISILALLAFLVSHMPTSYGWDLDMPEFSDPTSVFLALLSSGIGLFLATIGLVILRRHRSAWIAYLVFAGLSGYRFAELAPHFQG